MMTLVKVLVGLIIAFILLILVIGVLTWIFSNPVTFIALAIFSYIIIMLGAAILARE